MRRTLSILTILSLLSWPDTLPGQAFSPSEVRAIDSVAKAEMAAWRAPGMILAVLRGGELAYLAAYGTADVETGAVMTPDLMVSVASVSKLVTAVTVLTLTGEAKVDLDVPISAYLPWLTPGLGNLTMTQLLSHTAGLGEGTPNIAPQLNGALAPVCRGMNDSAFVAQPGETWGYTNMGYTLAGCVIEAVTTRPFPQAVTETVFRPLGMARSTFNPLVALTYPHAQGHDTRGVAPVVVRPYNAVPATAPAGALITTVDDLSRLARALLGHGALDGTQILPRAILERLTTVRGHGGALMGGTRDYGFGVFIRSHRGLRIVEHEGVLGGFGASFALADARGIAAIAVMNGRYSTPGRTTEAALEIAAGLALESRVPAAVTLDPRDASFALGRYATRRDTVEILVSDSRVSFRTASGVYAIRSRREGHWEIPGFPGYLPIPATPLELVRPSPLGPTRFVRVGWRIYRRLP